MAARRLRLGDTVVDLLSDGVFEVPRDILIHGRGAAVFPRAEVILPEAGLAFYTDPAERAHLPEGRHGAVGIRGRRHLWRAVEAHALRCGDARRRALAPSGPHAGPGRVPRHGKRSTLILLADALHSAEQATDPDLGTVFDLDPTAATDTRRAVLARALAEGWIVAGGHIGGFARVTPEGAGFRLAPIA